MTVVVSDTSPVRALEFLDRLDALPVLFGRILLPPAVVAELTRTGGHFRSIDVSHYDYLEVRTATDQQQVASLLSTLDRGEPPPLGISNPIPA